MNSQLCYRCFQALKDESKWQRSHDVYPPDITQALALLSLCHEALSDILVPKKTIIVLSGQRPLSVWDWRWWRTHRPSSKSWKLSALSAEIERLSQEKQSAWSSVRILVIVLSSMKYRPHRWSRKSRWCQFTLTKMGSLVKNTPTVWLEKWKCSSIRVLVVMTMISSDLETHRKKTTLMLEIKTHWSNICE